MTKKLFAMTALFLIIVVNYIRVAIVRPEMAKQLFKDIYQVELSEMIHSFQKALLRKVEM